MQVSKEESDRLLQIARDAIISKVEKNTVISVSEKSEVLDSKSGVFVTIKKDGMLRGCIGYPQAPWPLRRSLVLSAIAAAEEDPRFPPLRSEEVGKISIEVSLLSEPVEIDPQNKQDLDEIKIGRDGLVIESGFHKGLLLPQVATEENMSVMEFLEATCNKAGLNRNCWKDPSTKVYKFSATYYSEPD